MIHGPRGGNAAARAATGQPGQLARLFMQIRSPWKWSNGAPGTELRMETGNVVGGMAPDWSNRFQLRTYLHMLAQRAGMGVGLVAAGDSTIVRLVGRVDVTVLLAIAAVREPPLAAGVLALERFLAWKKRRQGINDCVIETVHYVRGR